MKKYSRMLFGIVSILIAVVFAKLYIDIVVEFLSFQGVSVALLKGSLLVISTAVLFGVYRLFLRNADRLKLLEWPLLGVYLLLLFILQMYFGNLLRMTPQFDFSAVYHGALQWLVEGSFSQFYEYYYYYPNNLGEMALLTFCFQIATRLGMSDYFLVGMLLNSVLSLIMVVCSFLIVRKLFSHLEAIMLLLLFALCPPMYFMAPVFYSDQLTMVFPPVLIWLFMLYAKDDKVTVKKGRRAFIRDELFALLIAGICFAGYYIKPTVFIVWIAASIVLLFQGKWKKVLLCSVNTMLLIFLATTLLSSYFYSHHLDKAAAEQKKTPIETWVYMGLNENPGFNPDDTDFSRNVEDPVKRKEVLQNAIAERIQNYGVSGLYEHIRRKGITVFADGTFELSYTFLFGLEKETKLTDYVSTLGSHYDGYWTLCALTWYPVLLFGICAHFALGFSIWKKKEDELTALLLPITISVFGLYLFLMMWEIHCRYAVNFYSLFVILAVSGLYATRYIGNFGRRDKKR